MIGPMARTLAIALLALGVAWVPVPAAAQEAPETAEDEAEMAQAEEGDEEEAEEEEPIGVTEEITVTGTRFEGRAVTETLAPVDWIDARVMQTSGATETGKLLQLLEPSANFSTTFISDGTDAIRPATLRSLGPDQVLVLVNGKRRHQQALIHYQQTVGRGSAGYDVNTIPAAAIDRIEVLRDGAAAQYGSDAIAGVVNIILKEETGRTDVTVDLGSHYAGDGDLAAASVNTGFGLGDGGFVNLTVEYRDRAETNRAGLATTNLLGWYPEDDFAAGRRDVKLRIGDSDAQDALLWLNGSIPSGDGRFYFFGGWSGRETNSSGFYRGPRDGRTIPALYPDGFLPTIVTEPTDASLVLGYGAPFSDRWAYDFSVSWGMSEFDFNEENTVNVSYWFEPRDPSDPNSPIFGESPTAADTGNLIYDHLTVNADFIGQIDWGVGAGPLNMAFGLEYREEGYEIEPGDPVSFQYGRNNDFSILIINQAGGVAAPGTQGFPGFQDPVDESRDNVAAYLDFESQLSDKFRAGFALRFEDYSDFGSTLDGKFSGRIDFSDSFALRGTVSTGFRAPGVQQAFFTLRSTNLSAEGVLTDTLTAANNSAVTRALGIPPLQEETSNSYSLGLVARPNKDFRLTIDAYRVDIDDRIIFSDAVPASIPEVGEILTPLGIGQVQFFTNAVDTKTEGIDIVALYDVRLPGSLLTLEAALSFNETEITARRSSSAVIPVDVLFPEAQITLVEEGQPQEHHVLGATWNIQPFRANLRLNYFGEVSAQWFTQPFKQTWGSAVLTDLTLTYDLNPNASVSVGGLNIFDEFPDRWDEDDAFPFPQLGFTYGWESVPFGINGGYYFARLNYRFDHAR